MEPLPNLGQAPSRSFFAAEPLRGEERVRDADQGDMVVPAGVGTALEVLEPQLVFEFPVAVLDPPAGPHAPTDGRTRRGTGQSGT